MHARRVEHFVDGRSVNLLRRKGRGRERERRVDDAHVGGRHSLPSSYMGLAAFSFLAVSQLSACMCLQSAARFGCERVSVS